MADYGKREDGTDKGSGWLGPIPVPGSKNVATEYSVGVEIEGKEVLIPSLVPTLTKSEVSELMQDVSAGRPPNMPAMRKAIAHARERVKSGLSPFAD